MQAPERVWENLKEWPNLNLGGFECAQAAGSDLQKYLRIFASGYVGTMRTFSVSFIITYRAKLLNADWFRQRAFFLNFPSKEGKITHS